MIGIYSITNKKTGQMYIGQSTNIERRFKEHIRGDGCPNSRIDNAIQKYGKDCFDFNIIKICKYEYLDRFEKIYIKKFDTYHNDFHYNTTSGGDIGIFPPHKHPNYGKHLSQETKDKISASLKGKNHPNYKNYARIIKRGVDKRNNQRYVIKYQGKRIKESISIDKLKQWFTENYPGEELCCEIE